MNTEQTTIDTIQGDGRAEPVPDADLQMVKEEIEQIYQDAGELVAGRREMAENIRYCLWDGQSEDGKKHEQELGESPFPFEGASDLRLRIADFVTNFRATMLVAAATRAQVRVKGMELQDAEFAHRISRLLRWVIRNQLGAAWRRELMKLAQYVEGDSPGAAVLRIYWHQELALETRRVTRAELAQVMVLLSRGRISPAQMAELADIMINPEREEEAAALFVAMYNQTIADAPVMPMNRERALRVVRDLREHGEAEFPAPYTRINLPKVCALRLFQDTFFPSNTRDYQRARLHIDREWVTAVEMKERTVRYGYSQEFVDEVLKHGAATAFPELYRTGVSEKDVTRNRQDENDGHYELLHVYFRAVNEDNVPGIYLVTCHHLVSFAAKDRELVDYRHGQYPGVFFARETLTHRLWDSRGCPEIIGTHQWSLKFLHDSYNDHTQLSTVPPLRVPMNRPTLQLVLRPLGQIPERRPNEIGWMNPPEYPRTNQVQQEELKRQMYEYFGIPHKEVPPDITRALMQDMVDNFLAGVKDALMQMIQICQQYMTDEQVAAVLGTQTRLDRSREAIQGKFDLELSFDVRDLDQEYLLTMAKITKEMILPMDTSQVIERDKLIARLFSAISPELAEDTLRTRRAADAREIEDEAVAFAQIAAGVEPNLMEDGQNHQLRLNWIMQQAQRNPESVKRMTPTSKKILEARIQHFQHMLVQQQNALIGRIGAKPALAP